jgi:predicted HAD superfamily Cof-like phosphohydrolase
MNEEQQKVHAFHERFGLTRSASPTLPPERVHRLRALLIEEELAEFRNAAEAEDLVGVADALADLLYCAYGAAVEYGIDVAPVFAEIHRSNMSKGAPACGCRADGKVPKGSSYQPPQVREVLGRQLPQHQLAAAAG